MAFSIQPLKLPAGLSRDVLFSFASVPQCLRGYLVVFSPPRAHLLLSRHARNSYTHSGQHLLLAGEAMGLQIAIRHACEVTILDLQGRATIGPTNDSLSANLRKLIDAGESKILLNLAGASQIDSSSISTIVRAFVSLRSRGANLKLLSPRGNVKLVLEMLRLLNVIPNFDDEATALISFESRKASSR
jgi:anti-anti-sigma factor